jgi:hypothetical protein
MSRMLKESETEEQIGVVRKRAILKKMETGEIDNNGN